MTTARRPSKATPAQPAKRIPAQPAKRIPAQPTKRTAAQAAAAVEQPPDPQQQTRPKADLPSRRRTTLGGQPLTTLSQALARPGLHPVLLAGSRDPNAKLTVMLIDRWGPAFAVKVATTRLAADVVQSEGKLLCALHARGLGSLGATVPRPVGFLDADGLPALVTGGLLGTPMAVGYHQWRHTARRRRVRADFVAAGAWLTSFQRHTAGPRQSVMLLDSALTRIEERFGAQAELRRRLRPMADLLGSQATPRTAVHGDYWFGNLLIERGAVVGVVDWEASALSGEPLRDVARFAVSYSLYLDRHVRPGSKVPRHAGLRADSWGAGLLYAVNGSGWYPDLVLRFCREALTNLGADGACARALLVAGIADVAATADHPEFARAHLDLLSRVQLAPPPPARRP
jgi:hypothetical protein